MHHSRSSAARLFAASALLAAGGRSPLVSRRAAWRRKTQSRPRDRSSPRLARRAMPTTRPSMPCTRHCQPRRCHVRCRAVRHQQLDQFRCGGRQRAGAERPDRVEPAGRRGHDGPGRRHVPPATAGRPGVACPLPQNPIQITNSTRGTGSTALGPDARTGRFTLPAPSRAPARLHRPRRPLLLRAAERTRPLPLFGYDFFQPARQIILARRRALLPRPAPRRTGTGNGTRSRTPQTGAGSGATYQSYPDNGQGQRDNGSDTGLASA